MNKSGKCFLIIFTLTAALVLAVMSAGCIDDISPLPDEVKVRGNIISVDARYIDAPVIMGLLFYPNNYEKELFEAVDTFLPKDDPVLEIGAGTGALSAYINKHLALKTEHLSLESNPYLLPLLLKTKVRNQLGTGFLNAAVAYGEDAVPIRVSKNLLENNISYDATSQTIDVPAYTVEELITSSDFIDKKNVTVVVGANEVGLEIFTNEPNVAEHVKTFIIGTWNISNDDKETLLKKAHNAGYVAILSSKTGEDGLKVFVFTRAEDPAGSVTPGKK